MSRKRINRSKTQTTFNHDIINGLKIIHKLALSGSGDKDPIKKKAAADAALAKIISVMNSSSDNI